MASISTDPGGKRTVQFKGIDGKRRSIRLGTLPESDVNDIRDKVALLETYAKNERSPDRITAAWLGKLDDAIYDKLAAGELVEPRPSTKPARRVTLVKFLDSFIAKQADKKRTTIVCLKQCRNDLVEYFGADKPLADVTEGDAEDWRQFLRTRKTGRRSGRQKSSKARASKASYRDRNQPKQDPQKQLAENTIRRRCGRARQLFQAAVRHRLIVRNPFIELKGVSVLANKSRDYFVTRDEADAVLKACPDSQWKLIFALSRYGGLRCPSEHLALTWGDVDFDAGRIVVRSPKTEHHEGKEHRVIPLFPELLPYLEAIRDELVNDPNFDPKATPMSKLPIITRYRDVNSNLRTQLLRIIAAASLTPWPKLFQNLRASRATELAAEYPGHVAAAWLGHSTEVAQRHYWQVTEADFAKAVQKAVHSCAVTRLQGDVATAPTPVITDVYDVLRYFTALQVAEAGVEPARGLPPNGF